MGEVIKRITDCFTVVFNTLVWANRTFVKVTICNNNVNLKSNKKERLSEQCKK